MATFFKNAGFAASPVVGGRGTGARELREAVIKNPPARGGWGRAPEPRPQSEPSRCRDAAERERGGTAGLTRRNIGERRGLHRGVIVLLPRGRPSLPHGAATRVPEPGSLPAASPAPAERAAAAPRTPRRPRSEPVAVPIPSRCSAAPVSASLLRVSPGSPPGPQRPARRAWPGSAWPGSARPGSALPGAAAGTEQRDVCKENVYLHVSASTKYYTWSVSTPNPLYYET